MRIAREAFLIVSLVSTLASATDGKVTAFIPGLGADPETQSVGEGVVADASGNVWWAETSGMNVRKFVRK